MLCCPFAVEALQSTGLWRLGSENGTALVDTGLHKIAHEQGRAAAGVAVQPAKGTDMVRLDDDHTNTYTHGRRESAHTVSCSTIHVACMVSTPTRRPSYTCACMDAHMHTHARTRRYPYQARTPAPSFDPSTNTHPSLSCSTATYGRWWAGGHISRASTTRRGGTQSFTR